MKYFRKYTTVKEALDYEIENNDFVITGWPFIPAVQISNTSFERHHVHTKVGPSFNAGYFSDDFSTTDNYGRKVYLPKDWILLAYIENIIAAGGYINTGYAPSMTSTDPLTTLDFDVTFSINTLPSSGDTSVIFSIGGQSCTVNSSGNISFAGATVSTALTVNNKYTIHIHWEATSGSTGNVSMSVYNVTNLTATDKLVGTATSTAQTLTTAQLVLFDATAGLIGRLYYFGVYEDNDIKLDSVPVVGQDNMAGMYNIRNAEFMDNSRTVTGPMYMTRTVSDIVDSTTGYQVTSTGEYAKIDSLKGNSLVWNQAVPNSGTTTVTLTSGNKYYTKINDSSSIVTGSGNSQSVTGGSDMVCDLTKMFGATIANDMTVTMFESMFPADFYPYNAGELLNVNAEGIKATDPILGTSTVDISSWQHLKDPSDPTKLLFPYGLCSAGDVRDEVTATQAIKRVDSSGSTYTALSTPVMVDLPRRQDYSYPVSLQTVESVVPSNAVVSTGETKPYTAPVITMNTYSGIGVSEYLPNGYTKLEYIESTGTQYIDTNLIPTSTEFSVKASFVTIQKSISGNANILVGTRIQTQLDAFILQNSSSNHTIYLGGNNDCTKQTNQSLFDKFIVYNGIFSATTPKRKLYGSYDNTQYSKETDVSPVDTSSVDTTIRLLGHGDNFRSAMKLYSIQLYQNGILAFNGIPSKSPDNVVGIYDTISHQFLINNGTGNFVAGPIIG